MTASSIEISLRSGLRSSLIAAIISGAAGLVMLMQDVIIGSHFATGGAADAYYLAISFPLLAINVFAGGTLLAVLVPRLTQYSVDDKDAEAAELVKRARRALGWVLVVVGGIWVLIFPKVVARIATGFSSETMALSVHLLWLLVPVLFFAGLAGVDAAVLNSRRRFVFVSTLPAYMPAGVILGVFLLEAQFGIYSAAIGLVGGGALQWLASRRLAAPLLHPPGRSDFAAATLLRLGRDYATAAVSAALLGGIFLTDMLMASTLPAGSAATYGYAVRPVILTLAFATAVVGNVMLPFFSHMVANQDWSALRRHAIFWCGLLALGSLPAVLLWHRNVAEIVAVLYQRGAFGPSDTARVAAVQQVYLLQIPFFLVAVVGWRVMNSLNRHIALSVIAAACFFANLAADFWLAPRLGLSGIAWGTNLALALWALLIAIFLVRLHGTQAAIPAFRRETPV